MCRQVLVEDPPNVAVPYNEPSTPSTSVLLGSEPSVPPVKLHNVLRDAVAPFCEGVS